MSNAWLSGQLAKSITNRKHGRVFWSIFFGVSAFILLLSLIYMSVDIASDYLTYEQKETFLEYKNGCLITESERFEITEYEKQEIKISELTDVVEIGDEIILKISEISGELIEIVYKDQTVYQKKLHNMWAFAFFCIFLAFPFLIFFVFMLVVTNIKHPGKRIDKIQKAYLLRVYK